jgi:uncharacterized membrane protein
MTVTIHMLVRRATDLIECGLSPADAFETVVAGERLSSAERERIEQLVSERDAYRNHR